MHHHCYLVLHYFVAIYNSVTVIYQLLQSRSAATRELLAELGPGAVFLSSSNHPNIMAGQGTTAVEFLEQVCILNTHCIMSNFIMQCT